MYARFTHETRNHLEQLIQESKLKPSFIVVTAPKSLIQFDCKTAASIYLDAQGTFKTR